MMSPTYSSGVVTATSTTGSRRIGPHLSATDLKAIEPGAHPEEEVGRFLTERARFGHVPRMLA